MKSYKSNNISGDLSYNNLDLDLNFDSLMIPLNLNSFDKEDYLNVEQNYVFQQNASPNS